MAMKKVPVGPTSDHHSPMTRLSVSATMRVAPSNRPSSSARSAIRTSRCRPRGNSVPESLGLRRSEATPPPDAAAGARCIGGCIGPGCVARRVDDRGVDHARVHVHRRIQCAGVQPGSVEQRVVTDPPARAQGRGRNEEDRRRQDEHERARQRRVVEQPETLRLRFGHVCLLRSPDCRGLLRSGQASKRGGLRRVLLSVSMSLSRDASSLWDERPGILRARRRCQLIRSRDARETMNAFRGDWFCP